MQFWVDATTYQAVGNTHPSRCLSRPFSRCFALFRYRGLLNPQVVDAEWLRDLLVSFRDPADCPCGGLTWALGSRLVPIQWPRHLLAGRAGRGEGVAGYTAVFSSLQIRRWMISLEGRDVGPAPLHK